MDNVKKILNTVSDAMAVSLSELVSEALSDANMAIANEPAGKLLDHLNVLLWTVSTEKQEGDLQRFVKVNPRLLLNLGKALEVAGIEESEAEQGIDYAIRAKTSAAMRAQIEAASASDWQPCLINKARR